MVTIHTYHDRVGRKRHYVAVLECCMLAQEDSSGSILQDGTIPGILESCEVASGFVSCTYCFSELISF